jgi:anti-sigma regulatory factor (Ser/Thr protein kinase)
MSELVGGDLPLGLRNEGAAATSKTLPIAQGSLLVMYTDGLTESTRDVFDGESRLREALADEAVYASASPADAIRRAVLGVATDDVAILTVSVGAGSEAVTRWSFNCDDALEATRVRRDFVRVLRSVHATEPEVADAELVFGELLGNVVRHTGGLVEAALDLTADDPVLHVLDRGPGFTFHARLPNDNMSETGRGLYITTRLAREVSVVQRPDGGSHARVVLAARKRPGPNRRSVSPVAAQA